MERVLVIENLYKIFDFLDIFLIYSSKKHKLNIVSVVKNQ